MTGYLWMIVLAFWIHVTLATKVQTPVDKVLDTTDIILKLSSFLDDSSNINFLKTNSHIIQTLRDTGTLFLQIKDGDEGFYDDRRICDDFGSPDDVIKKRRPFQYSDISILRVTEEVFNACFRQNLKHLTNVQVIHVIIFFMWIFETEGCPFCKDVIAAKDDLISLRSFDLFGNDPISLIRQSLRRIFQTADDIVFNEPSMDDYNLQLIISLITSSLYKLREADLQVNGSETEIDQTRLNDLFERAILHGRGNQVVILKIAGAVIEKTRLDELIHSNPTLSIPSITISVLLEDGVMNMIDVQDDDKESVLKNAVLLQYRNYFTAVFESISQSEEKLKLASVLLLLAAKYGIIESTRRILDLGVDTIAKDEHKGTALIVAITNGHPDVAMIILNRMEADSDRMRELYKPSSRFSLYLRRFKNRFTFSPKPRYVFGLNFKNVNGDTALILAAHKGYIKIVTSLFQRMSPEDINLKNNEGFNAFMTACERGHAPVVEFFLDHMKIIDVECKDRLGRNALMLAIWGNYIMVVKLLVAHMDQKIYVEQDNFGCTALILAASWGQTKIVDFLTSLMTKEQVSIKDIDSRTALMHASAQGHLSAVCILLQHMNESMIHFVNRKGESAFTMAGRIHRDEIIRKLNDPSSCSELQTTA